MAAMNKFKFSMVGVFILLLGIIVACGESSTPRPTATPSAADSVLTSEDVQAAIAAALAGQQADLTAADVQAAIAATLAAQQPGLSAADVQAAIAATLAAQQPGLSAADVQAAIAAALAAITPVATPTPTPPPSATAPSGTINIGVNVFGPPEFNLTNQAITQSRFDTTVTHDDMFISLPDGTTGFRLISDWSVDSSGLVYTLNLERNAEFNNGWGQFTADDLLFSLEQITEAESFHSAKGAMSGIWFCDGCEFHAVDQFTVQLTRPTPTVELTWNNEQHMNIHSKLHFDTQGKDQSNQESVGTGSWNLVEIKQDQFRRVEAIQDHWRKTPNFEEIVFWEIVEESTRLANFLTGLFDTATFTPDSVQAIKTEAPEGVKFMNLPGGEFFHLPIYGQQYHLDYRDHVVQPGADAPRVPLSDAAADCELPWVSCDPTIGSEEWEKARKVREAMAIAIDRQKLVNNIAFGDGKPDNLLHWLGFESLAEELGLGDLEYTYDPARARTLLTEAGFPDGFEYDMTLTEFASSGPIFSGEAVATMWEDIGLRGNLNKMPYSAWRPCTVDRSCKAIATHGNPIWIDPARIFSLFYHPRNAFNLGFEHPVLTELIDTLNRTAEPVARKALLKDLGEFTFNQVIGFPLFSRTTVWPISEKLDTWDIAPRNPQLLNNWEFAPHRAN